MSPPSTAMNRFGHVSIRLYKHGLAKNGTPLMINARSIKHYNTNVRYFSPQDHDSGMSDSSSIPPTHDQDASQFRRVSPPIYTANSSSSTPQQEKRSTPSQLSSSSSSSSSSVSSNKPPGLSADLRHGIKTNHVDAETESKSSLSWPRPYMDDPYRGIAQEPFPEKTVNILLQPVASEDVEIKPDGLLYLPEIKYRRILNQAFGPGGWALAPRGPHAISKGMISREYALFCFGRFVSQSRGEQVFFDERNLPTAMEGCKSNALMRCCKDLGIASELWDPVFIRQFKETHCENPWVMHRTKKTRVKAWRKKGLRLDYPYEEI